MEAMKKALRTVIIALLIVSYVFGQGLMISKGVGLPVRVAYAEGSADSEQGEEGGAPADPESTGPEEVGDPAPPEEVEQGSEQEVPEAPEEDRQEPEEGPGSPPKEGQDPEEDPTEPPTDYEEEPEEPASPPEGEEEPEQVPSESPEKPGQEVEGHPLVPQTPPTQGLLQQSFGIEGEYEIVFERWWLGNDGVIHPAHYDGYAIEASFVSSEVRSIEYEWSDDGMSWHPIDEEMIVDDEGLQYAWGCWYRCIVVNVSSWSDGTYYFRATAANDSGQCVSEPVHAVKESVFFRSFELWLDYEINVDNVQQYYIEAEFFSSTDLDSIELEWSDDGANWYTIGQDIIVEDFGVQFEENRYWSYWYRGLELDLTSWPDGTYYFRATATNKDGQQCVSEVAEAFKNTVCIRLLRWDLGYENEGVINTDNVHYFYVNVEFDSWEDLDSIEFEVSSDGTEWIPVDTDAIYWDTGVLGGYGIWFRAIEMDARAWPEGRVYLRVTATDVYGRSLSEVAELYKDTIPPEDVTDFTVEPSAEGDALVLTWTNPEDFEFVRVQRWYYYYWETLVETTANIYVDEDVSLGETYEYRIVVFDSVGNESPDPVSVTCSLPIPPLIFEGWWNSDIIYSENQEEFRFRARFRSQAGLVSINYYFSADGLSWEEVSRYPGLSVLSDEGLDNEWDTYWTRALVVDMSGLPDGDYWLKATAEDMDGLTLDGVLKLTKDTFCADAENLTVTPNEDNTALILSWTIPDPDDFDYADIYRYNYQRGAWDYIGWFVTGDTYVDTGVDRANPYLLYRYRVVLVDKAGNKSQNPPEAVGKLHSDSLMALRSWEVTDQGKINVSNSKSFVIQIDFYSSNPIDSADFYYKTGSGDWGSMLPFSVSEHLVHDASSASGQARIVVDVSGPLGIPDGGILLQAVIADTAGNTLIEEYELVKDTVPPAGVSGLTVNPNEEGTALVLTWTNPQEDFSHVNIYRDSTSISSQFTGESFTDYGVLPGVTYTYRVAVVDAVGNTQSVEVTAVLPTSQGPILVDMSPQDGYLTRANSLDYSAFFRCDKKVVNILFEISLDGEVWEPLNPLTTSPTYSSGDGYYFVSGKWNVGSIGEEEYLIRATAIDIAGRSTTTDPRTIRIDHLGPVAPADFTATVEPDYHRIALSWSPLEDAVRYVLTRRPANPTGGSEKNWEVYPPQQSFVDTTPESETLYIYSVRAYDLAGNAGDSATLTAEIHSGPALTLEGWLDVYTNVSQYTLRGVTEPGATVRVNGIAVEVGPDGAFSYSTELQPGEQVFTVVATLAGAQHTLSQRVVLDTTAPSIGFSTAPSDGAVVRGTVTLRFSRSSDFAGGALQVTRDDGATWEDILFIPPESSVLQDFLWDSTAPIGESGPLADGPYKFRAMAWDRAGNIGVSQTRIWTIQNTPPTAPRNVTAVGEVDTIVVSWLANVEPVSWYRVYRSILPGGPYARVAEKSVSGSEPTKYVDQDVESGTTYYYVVTAGVGSAYQGELESAFSGEVSAAPLNDTTPPTITAVPFTEGETYGWDRLSFGGGSGLRATDNSHRGVKEFIFSFSCDGGATWEILVCPARSYSASGSLYYGTRDTIWTPEQTRGLEPGPYVLRFSAVDYAGNESQSVVINITIAAAPAAPQNLKLTRGEGSIILTWDPVGGDGFLYYTVHRSTYLTGGYTQVGSSWERGNTTYTDTTVEMGKTYYYYVVHHNNLGTAQSAIVSGTASDDLTPPVVTEVSRLSGAGGPQIIFQAYATDNKAVSTMRAFYSLDGGATWEKMDYQISLSTTSSGKWATFTWDTKDLPESPALQVGVRVIALDAAGNESEPVDVFWTLDLWVNPATNLRTTPGDGTILLEWDPSPDGDIDRYRILRGLQPGGPYYDPGGFESYTTGTQFYDESVVPNTVYYYVVDTRDRLGNVKRSEEASGSAISDTEPPYIVGVRPEHGVTIGGDTIVFLFVYFRDNSGPQGCEARIEYRDAEGSWVQIGPVLTNPHEVQGTDYYDLNTGWNLKDMETGDYVVRYTVYDAAGNASQREVTYYVDRTPPEAPKNLEALYGLGQIGLAWESPPDGDVARYKVYRANEIDGEYTLVGESEGKENVFYSDAAVQPGLTYFYYVTAVDQYNHEGPPSNIASAKAEPDTLPPQVLGIEPEDGAFITPRIPITVRATDNISVVSITLEYSLDEGETWNEITTIATREEAVFLWDASSLNSDGPVKVRAIARDSSNNLSDGTPVRDYILDTTGPNVTGLSYIVLSPTEILLVWDPVTDLDLGYFVIEGIGLGYSYRDEASWRAQHDLVWGLYPDREYRFTVTAYDQLHNPGVPAEVVVITQSDVTPPVFMMPRQHSQFNYQGTLKLFQAAWDDVRVETFTFEYSTDGSVWEELGTVDAYDHEAITGTGERAHGLYEWDVSGLPEGSYYVRAFATDTSGNRSEYSQVVEYIVDWTAPSVPTGFTATSTSGYVELKWDGPTEDDVEQYRVYRALSESGPYEVLESRVVYLSYRDRLAVPGEIYFYKLTVLDYAGNESEAAGPVVGSLTPDTTPPTVVFLWPWSPVTNSFVSGKNLGAQTRFDVRAMDDRLLDSIVLEYREAGAGEGAWTLIGEYTVDWDTYDATAHFFWDATGLASGEYEFRAIATDRYGNVSETYVVSYNLHAEVPGTPHLTATPGGWRVDLSWYSSEGSEPVGYRVYRATSVTGPYSRIATTAGNSFSDFPLALGKTYYYYVEAVDAYRNLTRSETVWAVPTDEDPYPPTADAGDDLIVPFGSEAVFDGTYSTDNHRIERYFWDFGDGDTSSMAQPRHIYEEVGTYTVTLTVTDPAGNSAQDTCEVRVVPPDQVGTLDVRVVDNVSGLPLPGASVVIQYPDGVTRHSTSDSMGIARVVAPPGEYRIYAYVQKYKPAAVDVTVVRNQKTSVYVRLNRGEVVQGEIKVSRMTLDEIIAAGVDINAPENQNIWKFQINLGFVSRTVMVNGYGDGGVGDAGSAGPVYEEDNFSMRVDDYEVSVQFIPSPEPETTPPSVAYLVIPGEAKWLKEFFEVWLVIENTADPEFVIDEAMAHLKLPQGLSLAPTRIPQYLQIDMGEIAGGEKKEAQWIIRGDTKGEYRVSAEFEGILQPFCEPVKKVFITKEPFRVWGEDALFMHIYAQDQADVGYPYNLTLEMENVSDAPVYNLSLALLEEAKQSFIYAPNQELSTTIRELPPGATLRKEYQLIPSIQGELSLYHSYVLQVGGNANVESLIYPVAVPENAKGTAPVLTQENAEGQVHLSWDPVEGAQGYRIYYIRDDLLTSREPELVYTCGPEVTQVTLPEPGGPKDYVLTTVTVDGEKLFHGVTGLSWVENAAPPVLTVDPMEILVGRETELIITVRKGGRPVESGYVDVGDLEQGCVLDPYGQTRVVVNPSVPGPIVVSVYESGVLVISKTISAVMPAPPAKPMGLKAKDEVGKVLLTWFANSEPDLAGYEVYQAVDNVWERISPELVTETNYLVTDLTYETSYIFMVKAVNELGMSSDGSDPVEILLGPAPDTVGPWVISTVPANNQAGVAVNTAIVVNFSEDIDLDQGWADIVVKVDDEAWEYDYDIMGNSLVLTLREPLPHKALCEVVIPKEAIRQIGTLNPMAHDCVLVFYTGMEPDEVPPYLTAVTPAANEHDVPVNTQVSISFSEDIVLGPNYQAISLTTGGETKAFTTIVNGNVLTLTPVEDLPYSALCEVHIPAGSVVDAAGNSLSQGYSFRFFTGLAPDKTPPSVVAIVPADSSHDVPLNAEINVYFSEDLGQGASLQGVEVYAGDDLVGYTYIISENFLTLKPDTLLPQTERCRVVLPAGAVSDLAGNPLDSEYEFEFYTGIHVDYDAPFVQDAEALSDGIRLSFDETVQQGPDMSDVSLLVGGEVAEFCMEFSANELVLISLSHPLQDDWEVTIAASAVKDVSGNFLEEPFMFAPMNDAASADYLWERTFGGDGLDEVWAVVEADDGGYVFTGSLREESEDKLWLVKVDSDGNLVWERKYGGGFHEVGRDVSVWSDRGSTGFLITGIHKATINSNEQIWLIRTGPLGYSTAGFERILRLEDTQYESAKKQAFAVTQTWEGNYVIAGSFVTEGGSVPFAIWTDPIGQVGEIQTYGGSGWGTFYAVEETVEKVKDVNGEEVEVHGLIFAGYVTDSQGTRSGLVVKTGAYGKVEWQHRFSSKESSVARDVKQTQDGYIVVGYSGTQMYLLKLDKTGKVVKQRMVGDGFGYSVALTKDGGFIAAGKDSKGIYVVKTNADLKTDWEKHFGAPRDEAYSVITTKDEAFVVAGMNGEGDAYLIKFEGEKKRNLNVSSPNVFVDGTVLVYASIFDELGKLIASGEPEVEIEVTGYDERVRLNDAGEDGDFHPNDGVYSAWVRLSGVGKVEIKLYVDGHYAKKSVTVNMVDATPLPLVVVTDLEALYREFRNTGMSPTVDSDKNKIPDYYDLLDRLNKYAANHGGIVVDIRQEIIGYDSLDYAESVTMQRYEGPIQITETTTLKYVAKDRYNNWSKQSVETYKIVDSAEVAPVAVAFPKGGKFREPQNVVLIPSHESAEIYYTTDGKDPTEESTRYDGPIYVGKTTTLKYIVKLGEKTSKVVKEEYNIDPIWGPLVPSVSAVPGGGTYAGSVWVTLMASDGAEVYYTTDGSGLIADRKMMGELVDEYLGWLGRRTAFRNLAIIGDDSVVPYYRLESPAPSMKEEKYAVPKDYGNPTLIDTGQGYVMTDVPYGMYWELGTPENLPRPELDAGVGRVFAQRPANLIQIINGYEMPVQRSNAVVFSLGDESPKPEPGASGPKPSASGSSAPAARGPEDPEPPESPITITAGEPEVEEGKVTLAITTKNTGDAYENARYGMKVNAPGVKGGSLNVSYGKDETFRLTRVEESDDFVGYFGPEEGLTIEEGWDETTEFTIDFGTSTEDRKITVDAWLGTAPEPKPEEAVATMERVTINIPGVKPPPPPPPPPTAGREGGVNWPLAVRTALIPVLEQAFERKGEIKSPVSYDLDRYYYFDGASMEWKPEDVISALSNAHITLLWSTASHKEANTKGGAKLAPKDIDKGGGAQGHVLISTGSHMGYSVANFSTEADLTPYKTNFVKSILEKHITFIAPTTYSAGGEPALAYHDLLLSSFLANLVRYGNPGVTTIGDVQVLAYRDYWERAASPYGDDISTYAAYGIALYGLPTQPLGMQLLSDRAEKPPYEPDVSPAGFSPMAMMSMGIAGLDGANPHEDAGLGSTGPSDEEGVFFTEQSLDTAGFSVVVDIPSFKVSPQPDGRTLVEIPNGGAFLVNAHAPMVPLVTKSFILPEGTQVTGLTLIATDTEVIEDVDLAEFTPVNRELGPVEGTYETPNPYPQEMCWWQTIEDRGGTRLAISVVPVQYDPVAREVTLYHHVEIDVSFTGPHSGTSIERVTVNNGQPLQTGLAEVPVEVRVQSSVRQEVTLAWTVRDNGGLVVGSGMEAIELVAGSNVIPFSMDTMNWTPGYKTFTVYVSGQGVLDSTHIEFLVHGLNLEAALSQGSYLPTDETAEMTALVYDESGYPVTGLGSESFGLSIDGQPLSGELTVIEDGAGRYVLTFPLSGLSEAVHYADLSCQDNRGYVKTVTVQFVVASDTAPPIVVETFPENGAAGFDTRMAIAVAFSEDVVEGPHLGDATIVGGGAGVPFDYAIVGNTLVLIPQGELAKATVYRVTVPVGAVQDQSGNGLLDDYTFEFLTWFEPDTTPPVLVSSEPVEGATGKPATARVWFAFSETVKLVDPDGVTWVTGDGVEIEFNVIVNGRNLILVPIHNVPYGVTTTVTILREALTDQSGNCLESDLTLTYTVETGPDAGAPEVVQVIPHNGCMGVLTSTLVTVRFGEPVIAGDNIDLISWRDEHGQDVAFSADVKRDTLTLTPAEPLALGTTYTVTIPAGAVTDLAGNELAHGIEFSFTTGFAADTVPPRVEETVPANEGKGVLPDARVYIYFDEAIRASQGFGGISLSAGESAVSFAAEVSGRTVILTPLEPLDYNTEYAVAIPAGAVQDLEGNPLAEGCVFTFTTGHTPDTTGPSATRFEPGEDDAPVDAVIKVHFSEFIKPGLAFGGITVSGGAAGAISCAAEIDGQILTLTPPMLEFSTIYTVFIPAGAVTDIAGNSCAVTYRFTTVESPAVPVIIMTAGEATVVDGKVTLGITTTNTGAAYGNARYGVRVNVSGVEGDSISVSYGEGLTFSLSRVGDTDGFVGYFGPPEGFTITEGWNVTTVFTADFGTSTAERTVTVDAWVGQAPEPAMEEALAVMDRVTITIPAEIIPPLTVSVTPAGGTYNSAQTVTLTASDPSAEIFYTTDGSDPDENGTKYVAPIVISETTTLKFRARDGSGRWSEVYTVLYTITTTTPGGGTGGGPGGGTGGGPGGGIVVPDPETPGGPVEPVPVFPDIVGHWAQKEIEHLASLGIVNGYPGGLFEPDKEITRAEFARMFALGVGFPTGTSTRQYSDIAGHWAEEFILTADWLGYPDGTFRPDSLISRQELAMVIARRMEPATGTLDFADADTIAEWARPSVTTLVMNDIIHGYPDGTYRPLSNVTRAEASVLIYRLIEWLSR